MSSNPNAFMVDPSFRSRFEFELISVNPVAIGTLEPPVLPELCSIMIGPFAGYYYQASCAIAIGEHAGTTFQGPDAIAVGAEAGTVQQREEAVAIGAQAGQMNQGTCAVALGSEAGQIAQQARAVAVGQQAGQYNQQSGAVALGVQAAFTGQQAAAVALGAQAGQYNQQSGAVALGAQAAFTGQQAAAVALGAQAGQYNQQSYAIAIGYQAGQTNQPEKSIVINASGAALSGVTAMASMATYIAPLRNTPALEPSEPRMVVYNTISKELTYFSSPVVVGDLKFSAQAADHNYWLLCDGRSLSVAAYPKLHAVILYSFGGSGATFQLPDARGRVLGAIGAGTGLTTRALGAVVGAETHQLTTSEMPAHSHTVNDPGHAHTYLGVQSQGVAAGLDNAAENSPRPTETTSTSATGITLQNTGGGAAHNNMQPTLFGGNVFIFAGF